jgi:hypothetical protein
MATLAAQPHHPAGMDRIASPAVTAQRKRKQFTATDRSAHSVVEKRRRENLNQKLLVSFFN